MPRPIRKTGVCAGEQCEAEGGQMGAERERGEREREREEREMRERDERESERKR